MQLETHLPTSQKQRNPYEDEEGCDDVREKLGGGEDCETEEDKEEAVDDEGDPETGAASKGGAS